MRKVILMVLGVLAIEASAQIVDDTTELVYGPKTTRYFYEQEAVNNEDNYIYVDTSIYQLERQDIVDRSERKFQDLGSIGTALFPVFHDPQSLIGRTSGFNAYMPYRMGTKNIRFFDTKSPFIDLLVYLGGANRNFVNVDFSRNVREGWNVGFDLHKITTDKQLANNGEADRQVVSTTFDFYTHYKNTKVPYEALLYFSNMSHKVAELGGVRFGPDSVRSDLFEFNNALLRLQDAQNAVKTNQWHLYHDYQVAKQFQVYHIFDYKQEENTYQDFVDGGPGVDGYDTYRDAYDRFLIDADSTNERATFSSLQNEVGIKGDLSNVFYRAYIKTRTVDFRYFLWDPFEQVTENYVGGYIRYNWKEKFRLSGEVEILQGGEYKFGGRLLSNFINLSYQSIKYNVPYIFSSYFGNHYEWNNNFDPVFVNSVKGDLRFSYKSFTFIPKVSLAAHNNFLYFGEDRFPNQASAGIFSTSAGGSINVALVNKKGEGVFFENEVIATNVSGGAADVMRIPDLFYNGRYYWKGFLFGDKVPIEVGMDVHARSTYFANAYDPVTQQFYIQNELAIDSYFKSDVFFNMRLDKFYFGFKWVHFDQPSDGGYFATPWFPGQPRVIDLMVRWRFYD